MALLIYLSSYLAVHCLLVLGVDSVHSVLLHSHPLQLPAHALTQYTVLTDALIEEIPENLLDLGTETKTKTQMLTQREREG